MFENTIEIEKKTEKNFTYQQGDIDAIFERIDNGPNNIICYTNYRLEEEKQ
jgi:hypothetical protein